MDAAAEIKFKALFGVAPGEIKKRCILMPFAVPAILKSWQVTRLTAGKLYKVAHTGHFTLIQTWLGPGLTGDAVLYLKETPCEELFLFGSCGLLDENKLFDEKDHSGLDLGSLVVPGSCYALESFTDFLLDEQLLKKPADLRRFYPHPRLQKSFLETPCETGLNSVICATVPSLKLEEEKMPLMLAAGIQVVEMECSGFFAAAQAVELPALALFWISDLVKSRPFYQPFSPSQVAQLEKAMLNAAGMLSDYCAL